MNAKTERQIENLKKQTIGISPHFMYFNFPTSVEESVRPPRYA